MRPVHHLIPQPARIAAVSEESPDTRTFVLRLERSVAAFDRAEPGQFAMLSLLGTGEAAFTFSQLVATGAEPGCVVLTVRRVGSLTRALFGLPPGARVGVRGPFGRGFPDDQPDVPTVYVAGGCGLTPLKAAIEVQVRRRREATPLGVLYGARDPATRIHRDALAAWGRIPGVRVVECLEDAPPAWTGMRGVVTDHLPALVRAVGARRAAVCGPSAMLAPVANALRHAGISAGDVYLALERQMKCGYGECGHCYVNHRYVCTDGPVFSFAELRDLPDVFPETRLPARVAC